MPTLIGINSLGNNHLFESDRCTFDVYLYLEVPSVNDTQRLKRYRDIIHGLQIHRFSTLDQTGPDLSWLTPVKRTSMHWSSHTDKDCRIVAIWYSLLSPWMNQSALG